ncbi:hypothetical protein AWC04_14940 [Mycolicibacterium fallax]|uniref:SF3 helicase domain-containing protein n=1 Tax=Mycolicibacterium fallax TaxID=1793 RepID=A0A1X1R7R7_MYCFA|nr:hypothetical protein AWC04_14940 [Mycolicibacterium fallax]
MLAEYVEIDGELREPSIKDYLNQPLQAPPVVVQAIHREVAGAVAALMDRRLRYHRAENTFYEWDGTSTSEITDSRARELVKQCCTPPDHEAKSSQLVIPVKTVAIGPSEGKRLEAQGYGTYDSSFGRFTLSDGTVITEYSVPADAWIGDTMNTNKIFEDFRGRDSVLMKGDFDSEPYLLRSGDQVLDLSEGSLAEGIRTRRANRHDLMLRSVGPDFDIDARCPKWVQFVAEVTSHTDRDTGEVIERPHIAEYLQKAAGLSLVGRLIEQTHFILWARTGSNGKSVFIATLLHVMGTYAGILPKTVLEEKPASSGPTTDLTVLNGARMAYAKETKKVRWDAELLKELRSPERLTARKLYQDNTSWTPTHTLWLTTNNAPRVPANDLAFWRGVQIVPFDQRWWSENDSDELRRLSIAPANPKLGDELAEEAPGILNWMLEGLRLYYAEGLTVPEEVRAATAEAQGAGSVWTDFLMEYIEVTEDESDTVEVRMLFNLWKEYKSQNSQRSSLTPSSPPSLEMEMLESVPSARLIRPEPGKRRTVKKIAGIKLTEAGEDAKQALMGSVDGKSNVRTVDFGTVQVGMSV